MIETAVPQSSSVLFFHQSGNREEKSSGSKPEDPHRCWGASTGDRSEPRVPASGDLKSRGRNSEGKKGEGAGAIMSLLSLDISYYYPAAAPVEVSSDERETDMNPLRRSPERIYLKVKVEFRLTPPPPISKEDGRVSAERAPK